MKRVKLMEKVKLKKKAFTLIELLAVIVILAIILAIAVPTLTTMFGSSSKNTFEANAKMVIKDLEYKIAEDRSFNPSDINETNIESVLDIDDNNYKSVTVKDMNDVLYVTIVGKNKWDNLTVSGTKSITKATDTVTSFVRGANAPVLAPNMKPIKWNGTTWTDVAESDTTWYNYDTSTKQWANARTADGSMWVWIPRFIYKIQSANWHTGTAGTIDIQFTKGVDDNWNKDVIGSINLDQTANGSKGTWTNHPAFTFGDTELTGFWVAKFDASGTTDALKFVPNVSSLRTVEYISEMFTSIRNMETNNAYGWGTSGTGIDTHLMKNGEWGAVTYLTQSAYGKNALVWWNPSKEYITGCSSSSAGYSGFVAGCPYAYNTANGLQASTTGNIYGVYDTRGLVWEFTSAYLDNDNQYLRDRGSSIIDADPKYKDVYKVASNDTATDNYALTINKKGDAIYETSSTGSDMTAWYGNFTYMAETENPWILRNSNFGYMGMPGGRMRYHIVSTNEDLDSSSFRATLAVGVGL